MGSAVFLFLWVFSVRCPALEPEGSWVLNVNTAQTNLKISGGAAAWAQEGGEELLHIQGQEGWQ